MGESAQELVLDTVPQKQLSLQWSWQLLLESARLQPSRKASVQLIRSLVVSAIALVADFGTLVALKEMLGINYLVAATLSFSLGLAVNYILSVLWVFADRKLSSRQTEFVIFAIICGIGLALNLGIIAGLVQFGRVDYRLAKAVSTILIFFWNFLARKKFLY